MKDFLEQTHIVISIIAMSITAIISILNWISSALSNKWMRKREKSDYDKYSEFLFKIVFVGFYVLFIWLFLVLGLQWCMGSLFDIEMSTEVLLYSFSIFCCIFIFIKRKSYMYILDISIANKKMDKAIWRKFMYWVPYFCSIGIWGFLYIFKCKWINFLTMMLIIICEIMASVLYDNTRKFKYKYSVLWFKDDHIENCMTENVKQKGDWIIITDDSGKYETKYRKEDLIRVKYSNEKEKV